MSRQVSDNPMLFSITSMGIIANVSLSLKTEETEENHICQNTWQAWLIFCLYCRPSIGSLSRGTVYSDHVLDIRWLFFFLLYLTQRNKDCIALRKAPSIDVALISLIVSQGFFGFFVILTLLLGIFLLCLQVQVNDKWQCIYTCSPFVTETVLSTGIASWMSMLFLSYIYTTSATIVFLKQHADVQTLVKFIAKAYPVLPIKLH